APWVIGRAGTALDEVGLSSWVAELPDGLETKLGEGGSVLSAGEEQLVAFARILVRDPQVVILDEATARLDPVTEGRVQAATARLLRDRIGIVIAHRLSSVRRCDEVVVLADGSVVEAGPLRESERFAELLASSGTPMLAGAGSHVRGGVALAEKDDPPPWSGIDELSGPGPVAAVAVALERAEPPPIPPPPVARTFREIVRLTFNDPRFGLAAVGVFLLMLLFGIDGSVLPWLWSNLVDGAGSVVGPVAGIVAAL